MWLLINVNISSHFPLLIFNLKTTLKVKKYTCHASHVQLFVIPWPVARQAPLSMGFSRQEYWIGLPCPPPGDLPDPGIELASLMSPTLSGGFFTTSATWEALDYKLEDTKAYPGITPDAEISWSKGTEIIQSLFSYHCGIMLEISIKRYLKITHIFLSAV